MKSGGPRSGHTFRVSAPKITAKRGGRFKQHRILNLPHSLPSAFQSDRESAIMQSSRLAVLKMATMRLTNMVSLRFASWFSANLELKHAPGMQRHRIFSSSTRIGTVPGVRAADLLMILLLRQDIYNTIVFHEVAHGHAVSLMFISNVAINLPKH